jgi:hypothetical protein
MIVPQYFALSDGKRMIFPASMVASSESPGRKPSFSARSPGTTISPLLATLVRIMASYYAGWNWAAIAAWRCARICVAFDGAILIIE